MNFARTNLRNPLACPTVAAAHRRLAAAATADRAPARRFELPTAMAPQAAAPTAVASESLVDQVGACAMILFFLVLALFG